MNATNIREPLLTTDEVSQLLGVSVGTLNVWRCTKRYEIPYVKVGRAVRYRLSSVQDFLDSRTVGHIEATAAATA